MKGNLKRIYEILLSRWTYAGTEQMFHYAREHIWKLSKLTKTELENYYTER